MRKKAAFLLVIAMVMFTFAACSGGAKEEAPTDDQTGTVKTGLAIVTSTDRSTDAGDANGTAIVDSEVVAVMVDETGTIIKCSIDSAQTPIEFSKDGKIVTPMDKIFPSRQELGASYGMAKASGIGKEWNEQATAFADYVAGKTVDEVKGIAVNEKGAPAGEDLSASVTIGVGAFIEAVEKAVANAQNLGASADDKLGLGAVTNIARSSDAAEEDGVAQAYSYYAAATINADGVITSSIIDASITDVTFSKEGKITSDINASYQTKNELGDSYGMKKASSIGKEWNEQADAYAKYIVGKTMDDIKGIAIDEKGAPAGDDLKSAVTVHITDFTTILEKVFNTAK